MKAALLALAALAAAPFLRVLGGAPRVDLDYSEKRRFIDEIAADDAFERRLFVREVAIVVVIAALIAARIVLA